MMQSSSWHNCFGQLVNSHQGTSVDLMTRTLLEGCDKLCSSDKEFVEHTSRCKPKLAATEVQTLACSKAGCAFVARSNKGITVESALKRHIKDDHDFVPRQCPVDDCASHPQLFTTRIQLKNHNASQHKQTTARCPCCDAEVRKQSLVLHIVRMDDKTVVAAQTILARAGLKHIKWPTQQCQIERCLVIASNEPFVKVQRMSEADADAALRQIELESLSADE